MFSVMQGLEVVVCADAQDAVSRGYTYAGDEKFTAVEIERVVVVQNGTQNGNSSVDLVLKDQEGKRYVVMLTGALLKSIPCS